MIPRVERRHPGAVEAYRKAAAVAGLLDGIHSYCHSGRSFLDCFTSEDAAACAFCLGLVDTIHELATVERLGLDEIRAHLRSGRYM